MRIKSGKSFLPVIVFFLAASCNLQADVHLPRLIADGMVLQRDSGIRIWGWADKGEKVTVKFLDRTYQTAAGENGAWTLTLDPAQAGGPYDMEIGGKNHILLKNVLIGDVWVCSGQSNMVLPMERVRVRYEEVIADAGNPEIRQFLVPMQYNFRSAEKDLTSGSWIPADPETVLKFTAAGYFFARTLYEKYHVPIGLINDCIGGTPIEAWMSEETLRGFPAALDTLRKYQDDRFIDAINKRNKKTETDWYTLLRKKDMGYQGEIPWFDPSCDVSSWEKMPVPSYWADEGLGKVNGVVWFRKTVNIPAEMTDIPVQLLLGCIVDRDSVFVNGNFVATTGYQYPPRRYTIPEHILHEGKNVIVVRVINSSGRGGFVPDKPYELNAAGRSIDLKGDWKYRLGAEMDPLHPPVVIHYKPAGLFNGMIAPILNCRIKGVIWYQGESNTWHPDEYYRLFPAMISDWRKKWGEGDFPFLYVQLANFMEAKAEPSESGWAELRNAQLHTLSVPNTAMAVTIDIGEWNDIHPLDKEDVGERLALGAMKLAYGEQQIVSSGPLFQSMRRAANRLILSFSDTGSGLIARGDTTLHGFAIAGSDLKYRWATAEIRDNEVVVWNDQITDPVAVRYAWADNPEKANLYNREGLPASPFGAGLEDQLPAGMQH